MYKCAVIKVAVISIEDNYLIFYREGAAYVGELGHGFNPPASIHISRWCVMDFPDQWNVEVGIFGVLLGLVINNGWHEALIIGLVKDK